MQRKVCSRQFLVEKHCQSLSAWKRLRWCHTDKGDACRHSKTNSFYHFYSPILQFADVKRVQRYTFIKCSAVCRAQTMLIAANSSENISPATGQRGEGTSWNQVDRALYLPHGRGWRCDPRGHHSTTNRMANDYRLGAMAKATDLPKHSI
jgi:hypothetical protein